MTVKNALQEVKKTSNLQPKITVKGKIIHYMDNEQTLLECLELANVEVHYHCRDGFCGACRVTLVKGDISYPLGEPLAFVGEKEVLPCCCVPLTDITLVIDE
ncbi:MAG: class I ribonucleotide reductase maintenance protein YfaE [Colwellia sp.]